MNTTRPNILFILVDQMRYPPHYPDDPLDPLYQILRFQKGDLQGNPYADLFPGFRLLAVVLDLFSRKVVGWSVSGSPTPR